MIIGLINKSKEFVKVRNISECCGFIGNYVEGITVYRDKVEIKFKIAVPGENNTLNPLVVGYDLEEMKVRYKKAV